jgi:outer membrane protein TolC
MDFITPSIKPSIDALKSILGAARRKWGKRKYEKLLATTISELLKEHPDLTVAQANLAAAEAAGAIPDVNLLRAKSMYASARRFHGAKKKTSAKPRGRGGAGQAKKVTRTRRRRAARKRKI